MSWNYRDDDEDKKRKGREDFPFDIFGRGGMFADEMIAKFLKEIQRAMQNPEQNGPGFSKKGFGPFITGYSITKGPDGKPIVKRFGNVDPSKMGLPMKPQLKPKKSKEESLVDVFIEDKVVRIIAELPDVKKEDINVKATESRVSINAQSDSNNFSTEKVLSVKIKPKTATTSYKNGILELSFERKEPQEDEDEFEIKIE